MSVTAWVHVPVSLLATVWYLVAAADYLLFRLGLPFYVSAISPDQLAYLAALPLWLTAGWALGVWAGLAGAALLWVRHRAAAVLMALSFGGLLAAAVGLLYVIRPPYAAIVGPAGPWTLLAALLAALGLFLYARAINVRGRQG